jgi:hypothetical protein
MKASDQTSRAHEMRAMVMEMRRWRGLMSVLGREGRNEVEAVNFWTKDKVGESSSSEWTAVDSGVSFDSLDFHP